MKTKKAISKISSPDELNKRIESTNPVTWIALFSVILCLAGFFAWAFLTKIEYKIKGMAFIDNGKVTLTLKEKDLKQLQVGQKVYISKIEGEILSIKEDVYPVVSNYSLDDGDYEYYIITNTIRPIDYFRNTKQ